MADDLELDAAAGFIAPEVHAEFPALRLNWVTARAQLCESPREVKRRLHDLSSRFRGATAVAMRTQPIPQAYRVFFHQIGLDPDSHRTPSEEAALRRLMEGGFKARNLVDDALLIALVETGVPVWALDAASVAAGGPGIRITVDGDRLGSSDIGHRVPAGRLAVADERNVHGLLFGDLAPDHRVSQRTRHVCLFTVAVDGVPAIHVEEALWMAVEVLATGVAS